MGLILSILECCCWSSAASCLCGCLPSCRSSTSSRIMYTIILLLGTVLACICISPGLSYFLQKIPALCTSLKISSVSIDKLQISCDLIVGYQAVYRISFALAIFFAFFCVIMLCVSSSRDPRSKIQNGFWGLKFLLFFGILIGSFFIPVEHMNFQWMVVCMVGAFIFILVQMILLIDFGYAWNSRWFNEYQSNNSYVHYCGLLFFTIFFYLVAMASAVTLFIYYTAPNDCTINKFFIIFNLVLCVLISIISLLPKVQEMQPNSGILQASIISVFMIYLTWSAMISGSEVKCNPEFRSLLNQTNLISKKVKGIVPARLDISSVVSTIIFFFFIIYMAALEHAHTSIGNLMSVRTN